MASTIHYDLRHSSKKNDIKGYPPEAPDKGQTSFGNWCFPAESRVELAFPSPCAGRERRNPYLHCHSAFGKLPPLFWKMFPLPSPPENRTHPTVGDSPSPAGTTHGITPAGWRSSASGTVLEKLPSIYHPNFTQTRMLHLSVKQR